MEIFQFILHIDQYIPMLMDQFGIFIYFILFLIIFCETGLVVTPFLPGDSIIFACGALAVTANIHIGFLFIVFVSAAILGDALNYLIGHYLGERLLQKENRFIKASYIKKAQGFYDHYGGKAILLARFVPIVRTFAPFVAGIGNMHYRRFGIYNIVGAFIWVPLFLMMGYWFGNLPFMKAHFTLVVLGIIAFSLIPVVLEVYQALKRKRLAA